MKRSQNATITTFFKRVRSEEKEVPTTRETAVSSAIPAPKSGSSSLQTAQFSSTADAIGSWSKDQWMATLSSRERELLELELANLDEKWLAALSRELTKPYFLGLKQFLVDQVAARKTIFPPANQIYSWSVLSDLRKVRVVILGQDPYHNFNQAHGLAFSVNPPTPAPPSLVNIFKELEASYPGEFKRPADGGGLLTPWATQGVLLLNACLTVEAHKANSHSNKGWESFTEKVLEAVLKHNPDGVCFMAWGNPAAKRIDKIRPGPRHLILKSVHPSPLSASRGWFGSRHFTKANEWLQERYGETINWNLGP